MPSLFGCLQVVCQGKVFQKRITMGDQRLCRWQAKPVIHGHHNHILLKR